MLGDQMGAEGFSYKLHPRRYKYLTRREYSVNLHEIHVARWHTGKLLALKAVDGGGQPRTTRLGSPDIWTVLTIREGYAWDGSSGPTIDTDSTMRASCVHDALYQLIREGVLPSSQRKGADEAYRRLMLADGAPKWRAWYHYCAVRLFGFRAARG